MIYAKDRWLWLKAIGAVVGIAAFVVAIVWSVKRDLAERAEKRKCYDNGGRVEEFNCRTVERCNAHHDSNGRYTGQTCYTDRQCEWRCIGGSPEER